MTAKHDDLIVTPSIEETSNFMDDWRAGIRVAAPSSKELQWFNEGGECRKMAVAKRAYSIRDQGVCKSQLAAACLAIRELMP